MPGNIARPAGCPLASWPDRARRSRRLFPTNIQKARFNAYIIFSDQSLGVHNPDYVLDLLEHAGNVDRRRTKSVVQRFMMKTNLSFLVRQAERHARTLALAAAGLTLAAGAISCGTTGRSVVVLPNVPGRQLHRLQGMRAVPRRALPGFRHRRSCAA